jgi:hypothetical protein
MKFPEKQEIINNRTAKEKKGLTVHSISLEADIHIYSKHVYVYIYIYNVLVSLEISVHCRAFLERIASSY